MCLYLLTSLQHVHVELMWPKFEGYCLPSGSFIQCEVGKYNDEEHQINKDACKPCPTGAFCNTTEDVTYCRAGTYNGKQKQTEESACEPCEAGTFANTVGSSKCSKCIDLLSSAPGSDLCNMCAEGYYLKNVSATAEDITQYPSENCLKCPKGSDCSKNTSLQNIKLEKKHWRPTFNTSKVYKCDTKSCTGSSSNRTSEASASIGMESPYQLTNDTYCMDGHTGPLCQGEFTLLNFATHRLRHCICSRCHHLY